MTTKTITHYSYFDSSSIYCAWYNEDREELFVSFSDGGDVYRYNQVPVSVFKNFVDAESAGKFYVRSIKSVFGPASLEEKEVEFSLSPNTTAGRPVRPLGEIQNAASAVNRAVEKADEPFEYNAIALISVPLISTQPRDLAVEILELVDALNNTQWAYAVESIHNVETTMWE